MPDITHPDIDAYLASVLPPPDPVLTEMEERADRRDFPIVGPQVGTLLYILARSLSAKRIFEMGSGFGYSALWFVRALPPGGRLIATDREPANREAALEFLAKAGRQDAVDFRVGDAVEILGREPGPFDILFVDMDKERYPAAHELAHAKLRPGGLLIADNMLWFGRVLSETQDPATRGIRTLTEKLQADRDFTFTIVPIRDGVGLAYYHGQGRGAR